MTDVPDTVLYDVTDSVATVTMNRPEAMNALDTNLKVALRDTLLEAARDPQVRAVVLTGNGRAFCVGQDLAQHAHNLQADPDAVWSTVADHYTPIATTLATMPKPVVAALNGAAAGAGAAFSLACDFRIAAQGTELALPELNLGMIPGSGGTQRLARLVGLGRAKDIVMRRRRVGADEALALGLVTEVVAEGELDAAAGRLLEELSTTSPLALAMAKRVLNHAYDGPLAGGLELEGLAYGLLRTTDDFREGVEAFFEKRPPEFKGR